MEPTNLNDIIKASKNILIISHVNPDGDTLGSMLALRDLIYNTFKKKAEMMSISKIPKMYEFLKGVNEVKHLSKFDNSMVYDLVITLDVAAIDRLRDAKILFDKIKNTIEEVYSSYGFYNLDTPIVESSEVLLAKAGTGNDFYRDVKNEEVDGFVKIDQYITNTPSITVNNETLHFNNSCGIGVDGDICERTNKSKRKGPINYFYNCFIHRIWRKI